MSEEIAVVRPSITTLSGDTFPCPGSDHAPVASIPVTMVVHGGTGVLHGNMTSLTVNQYIGVLPERGRGAWDSATVRDLVTDAVKISADANSQLFHPSDPSNTPSTSDLNKKLSNKVGNVGFKILLIGLLVTSIVIPVTTSLFTKYYSVSTAPSNAPRPPAVQPFTLISPTTTGVPFMDAENTSALPQHDPGAPRIVQRYKWLARPARPGVVRGVLPMRRVVVCDTQTETCRTLGECINVLRFQQQYDMYTEHLPDITFNFLIGGDGDVYEGRGWDLQGAHTKHYNEAALGVALIGTFSEVAPSEIQLEALSRLINTGVDNHKISPNYTLVTHCQLREDGYPNKALAYSLANWTHFDHSFPISRCT